MNTMGNNIQTSEQLYARATGLIPGGVNSPVRAFGQVGGTPVYFREASGSGFTDADGNHYVDFCQSWGPLILGHAHPAVVAAVREAAGRGLSFGACHAGEVELAEEILAAFPGYDRTRMVSSGTEAVMAALRLARGVTGRDLILKFAGGYHGHYDGMLVKAGSGLATHGTASSAGVPGQVAATTLVAPLDDEDAVAELFAQHGDDIAAVIIEPLPANNGLLVQRREYLSFLREITSKHGALLIFDEVISGFRLHYGGYWQLVDIRPDIITLGKVIGGGMPLGAVVGTAAQMEQFSPQGSIYQAGTLSGNPVSLAAGRATLGELKQPGVYDRLARLGKLFVDTLAASGNPLARAQQQGSIVWPYVSDGEFPRTAGAIADSAMERFTRLYHPLLGRGYYLPPSSYEVLFISTAHSEDEVRGLAEAVTAELAAGE
jgi:glutamate-1-semialdehyde 2,1-aminomutase